MVRKCPHCDKAFFDVGQDDCPYCNKNLYKSDSNDVPDPFLDLFRDIWEKNNE